jgi:1,4-dihydroxy-2-naphthoyl-CoA hydrolase
VSLALSPAPPQEQLRRYCNSHRAASHFAAQRRNSARYTLALQADGADRAAILYERGRCHAALGDLEQARADLSAHLALGTSPYEQEIGELLGVAAKSGILRREPVQATSRGRWRPPDQRQQARTGAAPALVSATGYGSRKPAPQGGEAMPAPDPGRPQDLVASMPYAVALGITLATATPQLVTGELIWAPEFCTSGGVLHGGAVMSLADTVGAVCAYLNLPAGAGTATIESKTNLFRAVRSGTLTASARPLHVGRSFIVVQTDLATDVGKPVGQTTQTQAVLMPRLLAE